MVLTQFFIRSIKFWKRINIFLSYIHFFPKIYSILSKGSWGWAFGFFFSVRGPYQTYMPILRRHPPPKFRGLDCFMQKEDPLKQMQNFIRGSITLSYKVSCFGFFPAQGLVVNLDNFLKIYFF